MKKVSFHTIIMIKVDVYVFESVRVIQNICSTVVLKKNISGREMTFIFESRILFEISSQKVPIIQLFQKWIEFKKDL